MSLKVQTMAEKAVPLRLDLHFKAHLRTFIYHQIKINFDSIHKKPFSPLYI